MALPDVSVTVRDGGLGIQPANSNQTHVKIGVAAQGVINTIYSVSDSTTAQSFLGKSGPLVEAAALALATSVTSGQTVQGGPIYCIPVNPSVAGTVSAVTKVGTGAETLTVAAKNSQTLTVKITATGSNSTATAVFSTDGGATWSSNTTLAATLLVPGAPLVTLAFTGSTGAFVNGETYTINTAGTSSLAGSGTGTIAISAASPVDSYNAKVTIVSGGALGTATFKYTLDNGQTESPTLLVPSSGNYVIPDTGLLLTFSGTSTAGDFFTFTTTAAGYSLSDLSAAVTALLADPRTWAFLHVVGPASSVSNAAAMLAAVDTHMSTAFNAARDARAIIEVPTDTDSNILAAFAASASTRVAAAAGYANILSPLNGRIQPRNAGWVVAARAAKVAPSEDLGRVGSGPATGVVSLVRDERITPGLDAGRFATLRTIIGRQGFYVTNGRLMAAAGSDFTYWQNGRVMDVATTAVRGALQRYLNDSVRVDAGTGYILETDARAIEAYVDGVVRAAVTSPGYASEIAFAVNRTTNIISTGQLITTLRVTPLGYAKAISVDVGFVNPALQVTQV